MYRGREAWVRGVNTLRRRLRRPRIRLSPVTRDQRTPPQADNGIRHQREIMFRYRLGEFMVTPYPRAILTNQIWPGLSVLCRMKMLPVMILAKYHSSARSAVSESSNSSARLVSQCPNSSARLVSQCPNSSARLVFRMFQVELATRF